MTRCPCIRQDRLLLLLFERIDSKCPNHDIFYSRFVVVLYSLYLLPSLFSFVIHKMKVFTFFVSIVITALLFWWFIERSTSVLKWWDKVAQRKIKSEILSLLYKKMACSERNNIVFKRIQRAQSSVLRNINFHLRAKVPNFSNVKLALTSNRGWYCCAGGAVLCTIWVIRSVI